MPPDSYEELLTPLNEDQDGNIISNRKQTEYDDKNVQAIVSLLEFLDKRLDKVWGNKNWWAIYHQSVAHLQWRDLSDLMLQEQFYILF